MKVKPFSNAGGYTTFDNAILDYIMRECRPNTWKILCVAIRSTHGWSKEQDKISVTQFMEKSGIKSKPTAIAAIQDAVNSGYLIRDESEMTHSFRLNKQYEIETGIETKPVQKLNQKRFRNYTGSGLDSKPTKERKKENNIELPENLNTEEFLATWNDWTAYRKEIKKTMTERTQKMQLKKLSDYPVGTAIAMIEQSIENGWQGIFELKDNGRTAGHATKDGLGVNI